MSSSLSALEERSLLLSLEASSPAERSAFVSSFARVNPIAHAALLESEKRDHPPPTLLDSLAPPLQHGALPGMSLGNSGGRAAEVRVSLTQQAQRNPLAITESQRLMLRAAEAMKPQPVPHAATHAATLYSNTSSPASSSSFHRASSVSSSSTSLHRRPSLSSIHVPSYKVDPDIVRGRRRQFQMQLYSLLWGECTETDTEGVHPHVSSTKQAQDLFADLNVADVLLYGRTGMVEVPSYAQRRGELGTGTDRSTARSGAGTPSARSGRAPSILGAPGSSLMATAGRARSSSSSPPPHGHGAPGSQSQSQPQLVPCSPMEWYFMRTTAASNEKKLCRKVEFDHRHVVPEFENREQETPLLNAAAASNTQAHHTASLTPSTGKSHKGIVKTCEIICERFRMDQTEEEQNAATQAARLAVMADRANGISQDSSAGGSPEHSRPTTPPAPASRSPLLLGAGAPGPRSRAGSVMLPSPQHRGSVMQPRVSVMLQRPPLLGSGGALQRPSLLGNGSTLLVPGAGAAASQNEEKDASSQSGLMITLDSTASPGSPNAAASATGPQARRPSISPNAGRPSISPNAALGVGSIAGTPGSRALSHFHQRMQAHGRTDPTQTKLDKQYFNKDDLRTFLRNPYGKGALLKFVISKDSNCELIRATWVDKGPVEEALQNFDPTKPHSKLFAPPTLPRPTAPGFTAPPYAHRHIKFLVQTRTNAFKLNDTGFSFYERTLTYPHPNDHRTPLHDLENEFELHAEASIQQQTAYLKRRRKDRKREERWVARQKEKEEARKRRAGSVGDEGEPAPSPTHAAAAATAASASATPDSPADDAASLQAQRNNQHYRIRNYEAGSALYDSLRAICDKLATYFDLVLSSGAAPGQPKKKTKKMQLYFRRDACNQLWLLWSDCLEFEDPAGKAAAGASAAPAAATQQVLPERAPAATPLRWTGMDSPASASSGVGRSHTLKIHEEEKDRTGADEDDEDDYGDDAFSDEDDEDARPGGTIPEEDRSDDDSQEDSEDASETEVSVPPSSDSDDEAEGGRPSWRAMKRKGPKRKPTQKLLMAPSETQVDAEGNPLPAATDATAEDIPVDETPATKSYTCAHCRAVVLKHDVYYVLLHTLLHTYQLENKSKGFFHQRKMEWSSSQWQEAPISLAEAKEEARKDLVRQNSRALSTPAPLSSFLERPTSSSGSGRLSSPTSPSGRSVPGSPMSPGGSHRKSYSGAMMPPANFDASATGTGAEGNSLIVQRSSSSRSLLHGSIEEGDDDRPGVAPHDGEQEDSTPVPSFALFFDPHLDPAGFKSLSASPSYLSRDVPLCGKCIGHIWMDPLLIRDRFGQSINPIQHPLHNQRSIGAADGSGSGPGPASTFAWLKKKQMSAWDRAQLEKAVAASEHAASQGNTSAAALMFNEARGGKNFIALNVSAVRNGVHSISAAQRKQQRDLSTGEGKDPYTNPHALLNYWAHYSDTKEDRDLALSLQRRLAVAGAPSAAIYQLDATRSKARRRPEDLERVYGMRYVADAHGNGGSFVRSGSASGTASGTGTVRLSSPDKYRRQNRSAGAVRPERTNAPAGEARPGTAAATTVPAAESAATPNRSARTSPSRGSSARVATQPRARSRTRSRSPPQRDGTFLTGLDPEDQHDPDPEEGTTLELEEIVEGETKKQRQERLDAQTREAQEDAERDASHQQQQQQLAFDEHPEENQADDDDVPPSLSFSPSNRSANTSAHGTRATKTVGTGHRSSSAGALRNSNHTQSDADLVSSVFGGSRMEQRIAEKAQRRADRDAREALAAALMHHSSQGRRKSADPSLPLSPPTYLPNHEPKSTMSLIFDRPLSPIKGSADRRRMGVETTLSRALREETWTRARQKTEAKFALEAQTAAERLMFSRPGVPESMSSHQAPYNIAVVGEAEHRRREARAEAYKSIRRSASVERLRTQAEQEIEGAPYHSNIAYVGAGRPATSGPARSTTLQGSRSTSALARGSSAGVHVTSSTALAASAYAPSHLVAPRGSSSGSGGPAQTPAQIMAAKAALVIEATGGLNPPRRHSGTPQRRPHTAGPSHQMRSMLYSPATPTRSSPQHRGASGSGSRSKHSSRPLSPHTSSRMAAMDRAYNVIGGGGGAGQQTPPHRGTSAGSARPATATAASPSSSSPADWLHRSRLAESQQAAESGSDTRHVLALPAAAAANEDPTSRDGVPPSIPSSVATSHRSSPPIEEQSIEETPMELPANQPQPAPQPQQLQQMSLENNRGQSND